MLDLPSLTTKVSAQSEGLIPNNTYRYQTLGEFVPAFVRVVFIFAFIITLFVVIWGGFKYILSGGEEEKKHSAKQTVAAGIIGLVIIGLTPLIITVLATFFGIPLTIPNFGNLAR